MGSDEMCAVVAVRIELECMGRRARGAESG